MKIQQYHTRIRKQRKKVLKNKRDWKSESFAANLPEANKPGDILHS